MTADLPAVRTAGASSARRRASGNGESEREVGCAQAGIGWQSNKCGSRSQSVLLDRYRASVLAVTPQLRAAHAAPVGLVEI